MPSWEQYRRLREQEIGHNLAKDIREFARMVDDYVGTLSFQSVRREAVGYSHSPQPGIASSAHVDMRIADHGRLFWLDACFTHQFQSALRIRLLRGKAVPTINLREISAKPD